METKIEEIWKDIPEFLGYYQASNLGRIKRLETIVIHWRGGVAKKKERIIKQAYTPRIGYMQVDTCVNGVKRTRTVHTMVAKAFIQNPLNLPEVNHKDGNKLNNKADNFEWVTKSGNRVHAIQNGLIKKFGPEKLISPEKAKEIRTLSKLGHNQFEIADLFMVHQCTISRIINRKRQYSKF